MKVWEKELLYLRGSHAEETGALGVSALRLQCWHLRGGSQLSNRDQLSTSLVFQFGSLLPLEWHLKVSRLWYQS